MVRNRLAEVCGLGDDMTDAGKEELKPLKKEKKAMSKSQQDFFDTLQTITSDIDKLNEKGERIENLQNKILHDATPNPKEKDELNELNGNEVLFIFTQ